MKEKRKLLDVNIYYLDYISFETLIRGCEMNNGYIKFFNQVADIQILYRSSFSKKEIKDGIQFTVFKKVFFFDYLKLFCYIRKENPNYILLHGLSAVQMSFYLKLITKNNPTVIVQVHGFAPRPKGLKKKAFRWFDKFVDGYIFTGIKNAEPWIDEGVFLKQKIFNIMEGSTNFEYNIKKLKSPFSYLWVGRLDKNKDPITILKAFEHFLLKQPNAKLTMIYHEDNLIDEVNEKINQSELLKLNVCLVGKVAKTDIKNYYDSHQFFVLGSHYEGSGYALVEAMACGCIPIVTKIPSFEFMTNYGKVGLLFTAGNYDELLSKLLKSTELNIEDFRKGVLTYFNSKLSFQAIATDIYQTFELASKNKL